MKTERQVSEGKLLEDSMIFHLTFVPAICPFPTIAPYRGAIQYASHLVHWEGDMHRTPCIELSVWSSFDHLWAVFSGELLGDYVICLPCSFRQWSNTFRDLEALILWTFMIGVEVPKNVYNSCPIKHEVVNLFWCRVKCFTMRIWSFPSWEATCNKIQYNTLFCNIFHDLAEAGIPMLSFINSFFMYIGQTIVCVTDWWYGHIIL